MGKSTLEGLLARYPSNVQVLARRSREFIMEMLPESEESYDASNGVIGFGYGTSYKDLILTLLLSKTGVKLGVVRGAELDDPRGLLAGRGKVHRYVVLETESDLEKPG